MDLTLALIMRTGRRRHLLFHSLLQKTNVFAAVSVVCNVLGRNLDSKFGFAFNFLNSGLTKGPTVGCWNFDESLEVVKAACCRDPQCTGFSYGVDQGPYAGEGCCKADLSGPIKNKE